LLGVEAAIDRELIADQLVAALREAGGYALQKFRSPFKSWTKEQNSPVSEVDIAVDEILRERLAVRYPEFGWLSEESVDDPLRLGRRHVWIVDPIDGTRGFIAGRSDWCVAAALVEDGRPVLGGLFAPAENGLYLARAGGGATLNGVPMSPRPGGELTRARVAGPPRRVEALTSAVPGMIAEPKVFSLALRLARVAAATLDVAIAGPNSHDWDIAAADLIVHESGGLLTTLNGGQVTYNKPVPVHEALIAAGPERHPALLALMRTSAGHKPSL
jgi:myo-inositol-1(or 4)-monophosphatase